MLAGSGLERVTGRVVGDESRFDELRGGPDSNYRTSFWVGPLSALSFNHGLFLDSRTRFQRNPPTTRRRRSGASSSARRSR